MYLDESEEIKSSVEIQGPSVGAPLCIGRGPLVYRFTLNGKQMGLVHSNEILANVPFGGSIFRLVSAMQMERYGIRYVAGSYDTPGDLLVNKCNLSAQMCAISSGQVDADE